MKRVCSPQFSVGHVVEMPMSKEEQSMSELFKIVLTSALTIVGGVVVFTCGQLIERFSIEPVHELVRLVGEVGDSLTFYANVYANPGSGSREAMDEASRVLRQQASQLRARAQVVRGYGLWRAIGVLRDPVDVVRASENLIGLSNSIHRGDPEQNVRRVREIENQLGIIVAR